MSFLVRLFGRLDAAHTCKGLIPILFTNLTFSIFFSGVMDGISLNMVDYYKISMDPDYNTIMAQIENANTTGFSWSQYHAFWINTYNFAICRAVRIFSTTFLLLNMSIFEFVEGDNRVFISFLPFSSWRFLFVTLLTCILLGY